MKVEFDIPEEMYIQIKSIFLDNGFTEQEFCLKCVEFSLPYFIRFYHLVKKYFGFKCLQSSDKEVDNK